jgi:quinol monooxygenase YgiN
MIHVLASIEVVPGCRDEFIQVFQSNVPAVLAEAGCLGYEPTVDVDSGLPVQEAQRENVVTIVEKWESLDYLHAHLKAPHMLAYKEQVKDMVKNVSLQVLTPA